MSDSEHSESEVDVDEELSSTELGFLEKAPSWKLESRFFPSKVGRKPAWLALSEDIPDFHDLLCTSCNKPLIFLCQVYAPIEGKDASFHRILYVFVCKTDFCTKANSNTGFRVYRSQLPRANKYYPFDPPIENESWRSDICAKLFNVELCDVCGIRSTNRCGKCKTVYYCSKEHQVFDWKSGHKEVCSKGINENVEYNNESLLFFEHEIITEPESDFITEDEENDKDMPISTLPKYQGSLQKIQCDDDLEKMAFSDEDGNFAKFCKKIRHAPRQVLRYERNGMPLWISDHDVPVLDETVENCQYCGKERIFEFQIMPQLLNYLGLDVSQSSLDWGTLLIFTCKNSCAGGPSYKLEYLLKQDMNVKE